MRLAATSSAIGELGEFEEAVERYVEVAHFEREGVVLADVVAWQELTRKT